MTIAAMPFRPVARCRPARDSALIAGRNLRVLRKNPGRMIYPLVQPLVLLVMFVSVFGNLAVSGHAAGASGTYREFLIPGIIIENRAASFAAHRPTWREGWSLRRAGPEADRWPLWRLPDLRTGD